MRSPTPSLHQRFGLAVEHTSDGIYEGQFEVPPNTKSINLGLEISLAQQTDSICLSI